MPKLNRLPKTERHIRILKLLDSHGQVTVPEISHIFSISEVTVRRDLEEMDLHGFLRRTHGGAVPLGPGQTEPQVLERYKENGFEKQRIGHAAAASLREHETIFLGSGTTVLEMAKQIPADMHLTVITNSLPITNELAGRHHINLIIIGGMFRKDELAFVGYMAEQSLHEFRADRVFMGIRSIHIQHGLTNEYFPESTIDRFLFSFASKVVVLADHTKFERVSPVFVAPVTAAQEIITDTGVSEEQIAAYRALGLQITLA
jgi:DeoR/GlpR family transcriptional regulator of sugar metabolism